MAANNHAPASVPQENKMGVMPINKLILNMSLPMMVSMLVQALYNVVDSIFVAQISENALTALSLAFPIQSLMIAVAAGTGVGINSLVSRSLGEKNFRRAQSTAVNGIFLALVSCLVFVLLGATMIPAFYHSQTVVHVVAQTSLPELAPYMPKLILAQINASVIVQYGEQYLTICCCLSIGLFFGITFERLLQSTGRTFYTMITQTLGAVINIILDPIMIFGLLGFPRLGVAGAAIATVVGQICGASLTFFFCRRKNPELPLHFRGFRPDGGIIKAIYVVGLPSIIMQSISSVMTYGINRILFGFSTTATAVFGVYFKLQSFIFMPVFGLNNGLVPIMGYNFGARNRGRIMKTMKLGVLYAMGIMGVGVLIFQIFPGPLLQLFKASGDMLAIGKPALRIISISFVPAAYCIVCGCLFQALGNGLYSMVVSVARQLVVLLPVAWLLSRSGVLELVWWAFPIAEVASVCISTICFRRIYRKKILPLDRSAA